MLRPTIAGLAAALSFPVCSLLFIHGADAALTGGKCLVLKRQAWSTLRKCEATEQIKRLKGKPADLATCQTKFQAKLAKIATKATAAAIACRYGNNGDGTLTDYDTGLQWEIKEDAPGGFCPFIVGEVPHCVNFTYTWSDAYRLLNGESDGATAPQSFLAGYADWRLPSLGELHGILDVTVPGCGSTILACIDPIFGPTVADQYWTATTFVGTLHPDEAFYVDFQNFPTGGASNSSPKGLDLYVRGVRSAL